MIKVKNGPKRTEMVKTGSSYLSQSELPVTFGLGASGEVESADVIWPGGQTEKLGALPSGHLVVVEQGRGIVERTPFGARQPAAPTPSAPAQGASRR